MKCEYYRRGPDASVVPCRQPARWLVALPGGAGGFACQACRDGGWPAGTEFMRFAPVVVRIADGDGALTLELIREE